MKKLITAVAIMLAAFTNAQVKEGSITYAVTIEGMPPEQAAMMGDMENKLTFKDKKVLQEMNSMMYSYKISVDESGMLMLMESMGNKTYTKWSKADLDKQKEGKKDPKIEYTNDTKTIAGYECKKAIITNEGKDGETKTDVWYTEKIPYVAAGGGRRGGGDFSGIKGALMEFSVNQGPMKVKMTATNVSLDKVSDSIFALSTDGYTEMKPDDLKRMQGGGK